MEPLSTRERSIRAGIHKRRAERWRHIRELILFDGGADWLHWWAEHWPPDKRDMSYLGMMDTAHLRRHVKIECHYLRMPPERQMRLEAIIWG